LSALSTLAAFATGIGVKEGVEVKLEEEEGYNDDDDAVMLVGVVVGVVVVVSVLLVQPM
jgi:hypothetical protein